MNKIGTLKELVHNINKNYIINTGSIKYLSNIIDRYNGSDWNNYIKISNNYSKELVYRNNNYELFVITWMPKSKSKIHNHSKNGCLFKILDGKLIEDWYTNNNIKFITRNYYNNNEINYISNENYFHKIFNNSNEKTISLHLYSPPLIKTEYFNK